jgi:hypothetical protein
VYNADLARLSCFSRPNAYDRNATLVKDFGDMIDIGTQVLAAALSSSMLGFVRGLIDLVHEASSIQAATVIRSPVRPL